MYVVTAMGTATIPESEPAEPVVVVVPIFPPLPTAVYEVEILRPSELPADDVEVTAQTENDVTLTVTRPNGYAGSPLTVHPLCFEDIDSSWVDVSADLDAGWTGSVSVRKIVSVVYLNFTLTPTASIDGTAKIDFVSVLNGLDPIYRPDFTGRGFCVDETEQVITMVADPSGSVFVQGTAGVTGTWVDGVFGITGQISWVAGA